MTEAFGRTIQLFLVDGTPTGLVIASIHGWTGSVLVSTQATFASLLARPETDRTGVYILYGPDPEDDLRMRCYIGEADSVRERVGQSAGARGFWETAVVITTSDEALTKGHVRYVEARLIQMTKDAGRVVLDNSQRPDADRRRLPEADQANMEAFLANLKVILPVVGLDLLKARSKAVAKPVTVTVAALPSSAPDPQAMFEIRHRSGVKAFALEEDGEFVVLAGSEALKNSAYTGATYGELKQELIAQGVLATQPERDLYVFTRPHAFRSPSAASAVVLDRNSNGRREWRVIGSILSYHEWQEERAAALSLASPAPAEI